MADPRPNLAAARRLPPWPPSFLEQRPAGSRGVPPADRRAGVRPRNASRHAALAKSTLRSHRAAHAGPLHTHPCRRPESNHRRRLGGARALRRRQIFCPPLRGAGSRDRRLGRGHRGEHVSVEPVARACRTACPIGPSRHYRTSARTCSFPSASPPASSPKPRPGWRRSSARSGNRAELQRRPRRWSAPATPWASAATRTTCPRPSSRS